MKRKAVTLFILIGCFQSLLLSCKSQSDKSVGEFIRCIPDLKSFIQDNEEVFMELRVCFMENEETKFYVKKDSMKNNEITIVELNTDTGTSLNSRLDDSSIVSEADKNLIRKVLAFSSEGVSLDTIGFSGDYFEFTAKNLVRMELIYNGYGINSGVIEERKGFSAYWEEIHEYWYVFIIVSKPA